MFSPTVVSDLSGLVGYRQNVDNEGTQLTALTTSSSGLYVNDIHPLLTINNISSVALDGLNNLSFTQWLTNVHNSAILEALYAWANEKVIFNNANRVMDSGIAPIYSRVEDNVTANSYVGLEVVPGGKGRAITIHRIGLDFADATIGAFDLSIIKAGDQGSQWSESVTFTEAERIKWIDVNQTLTENVPYFILYDATGKTPVNRALNFATMFGCRGVNTGQGDVSTMWNLEHNSYSKDNNWGLHIDYSYGCDLTQFIKDNARSFARLFQYAIGIRLLRELLHNPEARVNRHEVNAQSVRWDLEGDTQGRPTGLMSEYTRELKSLTLDMSGIDKKCLGCKRGISYGAV